MPSGPSSRTGNARWDTGARTHRWVTPGEDVCPLGFRKSAVLLARQGNRVSCRWLNVVAEHAYRQRHGRSHACPNDCCEAGRWQHDALGELRCAWPRRGDGYVRDLRLVRTHRWVTPGEKVCQLGFRKSAVLLAGQSNRVSCRWLNVVVKHAHRQRDDRPHARPNDCREVGRWQHGALGELRCTWPRRGNGYARDLRLAGSVTPFRMFFGRDLQTQFGALPSIVETGTPIRLTYSSHSKKHAAPGKSFCSDTRRRGEFANVVTRRSTVQLRERARKPAARF